jgi:hypothetical protein
LSYIEDRGIDAASFWQHLFYDRYPISYEETRETNPPDFLLSGIFAAQFVNLDGPALLSTKSKDQNHYAQVPLREVLVEKLNAGCVAANRTHPAKAQQYLDLYGKMLQPPILNKNSDMLYA